MRKTKKKKEFQSCKYMTSYTVRKTNGPVKFWRAHSLAHCNCNGLSTSLRLKANAMLLVYNDGGSIIFNCKFILMYFRAKWYVTFMIGGSFTRQWFSYPTIASPRPHKQDHQMIITLITFEFTTQSNLLSFKLSIMLFF